MNFNNEVTQLDIITNSVKNDEKPDEHIVEQLVDEKPQTKADKQRAQEEGKARKTAEKQRLKDEKEAQKVAEKAQKAVEKQILKDAKDAQDVAEKRRLQDEKEADKQKIKADKDAKLKAERKNQDVFTKCQEINDILNYPEPDTFRIVENIHNHEVLDVLSKLNPSIAGYYDIPDALKTPKSRG